MSLAQTSVMIFILYPNKNKGKRRVLSRHLTGSQSCIIPYSRKYKCIFNEDVFALTDKTFFITEAQFNKKARVTPDNMAING